MPWHILRLWLLLSLATLLAGLLLAPAPVRAEDRLNHAGLVVRDAQGGATLAPELDPRPWKIAALVVGLVAALTRPSEDLGLTVGHIQIDGQDAARLHPADIAQTVGYPPQDPSARYFAETLGAELVFTLKPYWTSAGGELNPRAVLSGSLSFTTAINKRFGDGFLTPDDVLSGLG